MSVAKRVSEEFGCRLGSEVSTNKQSLRVSTLMLYLIGLLLSVITEWNCGIHRTDLCNASCCLDRDEFNENEGERRSCNL